MSEDQPDILPLTVNILGGGWEKRDFTKMPDEEMELVLERLSSHGRYHLALKLGKWIRDHVQMPQ